MTPDKTPSEIAMQPCCFCGMPCAPNEYHPYAACLMFKACHNSETVRANLEVVRGSPVVAVEPEGWITWWRTAAGVRDPIYSHGPKKPSHGAEMDALLRKYPVFSTPQPTQAQAGAVQLTPDQIKALKQARSTAMHMTAAGRIPECGEFAAIAQDLDWLCESLGIKGGQHDTE